MKTARRIAPALLNGLTIPCFARCCSCSRYSGDWPRRKKRRNNRRSDPNGACAQQHLVLVGAKRLAVSIMMVRAPLLATYASMAANWARLDGVCAAHLPMAAKDFGPKTDGTSSSI